MENEYAYFGQVVRKLTGIDLDAYKSNQMRRRIMSLVVRNGAKDFVEYARLIQNDPERRNELREFITINVSEFFRDSARFENLQQSILPSLIAHGRKFKAWSAGCSNGSEPYTLAIILEEMGIRDYAILATDIDRTVLNIARDGRGYGPESIRGVKPGILAKYFVRQGGRYDIQDVVKRHVTFASQNLLSDSFGTGFDLILCRNVTIYFTDEAKDVLYRKFLDALRPGGVLFIGGTEVMLRAKEIGFESKMGSFYVKPASVGNVIPALRQAQGLARAS